MAGAVNVSISTIPSIILGMFMKDSKALEFIFNLIQPIYRYSITVLAFVKLQWEAQSAGRTLFLISRAMCLKTIMLLIMETIRLPMLWVWNSEEEISFLPSPITLEDSFRRDNSLGVSTLVLREFRAVVL